MKLLVVGASGGTGIEVIHHALKRQHDVTAFVRSPDRLINLRQSISIRSGNLLHEPELAAAIEGKDAVISTFGPRLPIKRDDADLLERFAKVLSKAMARVAVSRVVIESVAFLFRNSILPPSYLIGRLFFPGIVADAESMEAIIRTSALAWTLVRPPQLTDGIYTGRYRVREKHLPLFGLRISRSDVAEFMVRSIDDSRTIRKIYGVSN